jgi:molecular chaperone DnaK
MYLLGVDLGTTFTAAAVHRDGRAEIVSLANRTSTIPSVVFIRDDGAVLVGDAANRRALTEPGRVSREFKRRIGDQAPVLLGGTPHKPEELMSFLLRWVLATVAEREGEAPDWVAVTHPANWGLYKQNLIGDAARAAGLTKFNLLTEPQAAAVFYASQERVEPGAIVAVYDLGGGTFDAAVLRKGESNFEILGAPDGVERLGGLDFDDAVFQHVIASLGSAVAELDPDDPAVLAGVARLREECTSAKEALSSDTDVSIPVLLPNVRTEVRLTRAEFEDMIEPAMAETIEALSRALNSADIDAKDLSRVLLVGGSSRIPLISQRLSAELGRPVAVDAHPKHSVAVGAVLALADARRTREARKARQAAEAANRPAPPPLPYGTPDRPGPVSPPGAIPGVPSLPLPPPPPGAPRPAPGPATVPASARSGPLPVAGLPPELVPPTLSQTGSGAVVAPPPNERTPDAPGRRPSTLVLVLVAIAVLCGIAALVIMLAR